MAVKPSPVGLTESNISKYALGCEYLVNRIHFGDNEAEKYLQTIRDIGITISTENETNYFS